MKRINVVFSMAAVIMMTASVVSAQPESAASAKIPKYVGRYTVNYATGGQEEGTEMLAETVVAITNRYKNDNGVLVLFRDSTGEPICLAAGMMPSNFTQKFATAAAVPPFHAIDYPAFAILDATATPPTTSGDPCPPFQGRAEIYSTNPNIQVAPFLSAYPGGLTAIPVQKGTQATKGGH